MKELRNASIRSLTATALAVLTLGVPRPPAPSCRR